MHVISGSYWGEKKVNIVAYGCKHVASRYTSWNITTEVVSWLKDMELMEGALRL